MPETKARHHVKALTYRPKIEAVFNGECRQTIRRIPKDKFLPQIPSLPRIKVGDTILFHTWAVRPYRSEWDRRLEARVTGLRPIFNWDGVWHEWASNCEIISGKAMDDLARLDGIEPPTEAALESLLMKLNGLKDLHDTDWLVITFEASP